MSQSIDFAKSFILLWNETLAAHAAIQTVAPASLPAFLANDWHGGRCYCIGNDLIRHAPILCKEREVAKVCRLALLSSLARSSERIKCNVVDQEPLASDS